MTGAPHGREPLPAVRPPQPMTPARAAEIESSPFTALGLLGPLVRALLDEGYTVPTPVQGEVIPVVLEGRDVLACAQTGTGKTAAFVLPLLQNLVAAGRDASKPREIRVLIVTPTRELASQIGERISVYGAHRDLHHAVIFGGVSQLKQQHALERAPDILVATPGRLLDLMQQGYVKLGGVRHLVLDEADRMLDMGFVHDVRRICAALPKARQTLLLSATIPADIESLARSMLVNPARVAIKPAVTTAERVDQSVVFVDKADKRAALERLLSASDVVRAIVFTRTKHGANRLTEQLERAGIGAAAIHGNKSQGARERALEGFKSGALRVLVATDVAARGIDVDGISHVVNYDLPEVPECYVHRIGRTGRAGAAGRAISFCDTEERPLLADIERLIRRKLPLLQGERAPQPQPQPQRARAGQERGARTAH